MASAQSYPVTYNQFMSLSWKVFLDLSRFRFNIFTLDRDILTPAYKGHMLANVDIQKLKIDIVFRQCNCFSTVKGFV